MYGSTSVKTLATTDIMSMEQHNKQKNFNNERKAKATNLINYRNDKQQHQEHKQQWQNNRQLLDYNYEFKTKRSPEVLNKENDYMNVNTNKGTIIIDNIATAVIMSPQQNSLNNLVNNRGCGNVGANCSNCRNIKILLRLSLRYFYDINCEFVKNII